MQAHPAPACREPAHLLSGLLLIEVCLLAGMAGITAWRFPVPGLFCGILILWLDRPRTFFFNRPAGHTVILVCSFLLGCSYTALREADPPPVPPWLEKAASPYLYGSTLAAAPRDTPPLRPEAVDVTATVVESLALPGGRLRVILTDIAPTTLHSGGNQKHPPAEWAASRRGRTGTGEEQEAGTDRAVPTALDAVEKRARNAPERYSGNVVWTWSRYDPSIDSLLPGQCVRLQLRFIPVRSFANPETWSPEPYWKDRGVYFRGLGTRQERPLPCAGEQDRNLTRFPAEQRQWLMERFHAALPLDRAGAAILPALVFGDRSSLTPEQADLFARSTLAHSLALSGLHMGFAVLAGYIAARAVGAVFPFLWLRIPRPGFALLLSLPFALIYLWLGQSPVSLLRAACMLFFWTLLFFLGRPKVVLDGLFAALACILLVNPFALFELSLQLSALCIAVLALCLPGIIRITDRLLPLPKPGGSPLVIRKLLRGACVICASSLCIQIALLPLTLNAFGTSGLFFPLNILWLPVLGSIVLPLAFLGLLAAGAGLSGLAALLLKGASLPCTGLLYLLERLDAAGFLLAPVMPRPHWVSAIGFWIVCIALPAWGIRIWRRWKNAGIQDRPFSRTEAAENFKAHAAGKRIPVSESPTYCLNAIAPLGAGLFLLLLPLGVEAWSSSRVSVTLTALDVGQGQSVLVEWTGLGGSRTDGRLLIDGGGFASGTFDVGKAVVSPVLTYIRMPKVWAVINSHPDADHLDGLLYILRNFSVGGYYGNGDTPSPVLARKESDALAANALRMQVLRAGDVLEPAPGLQLEVLWPIPDKTGKRDRNDNSLVLRLVWKGKGLALIPGDASAKALRDMLEAETRPLDARVLVLPHHGSATGLLPALYERVKPDIALASCGYTNVWRYPASKIVERLRGQGAEIYSTAVNGQIRVRWSDPSLPPRTSFGRP